MNFPIQFVSKNNAVGGVYADAGMHTPAGLQSVQENENQEQENENGNGNH